jgi:hypothetical protein
MIGNILFSAGQQLQKDNERIIASSLSVEPEVSERADA